MRFCNLISCRGKSYFDLLRILQETIVSARCVSRCESWLRLVALLCSLWYRLLKPVRALSGIQCTDAIEGRRLQRSEFPTCASRISFCPKLCAALPLSCNSVDAKHRSTCVPCVPCVPLKMSWIKFQCDGQVGGKNQTESITIVCVAEILLAHGDAK